MKRNNVINPNAINILCREPQRNVQPHSEFETIPTPEPTKKSFWDKTKETCGKVCGEIKGFFEKVADMFIPIVAVAYSLNKTTKAGKELYGRFNKKHRANPCKNPRKKRIAWIEVGI